MRVKLKGSDRQVMVMTGATSGIGLVTARTAAQRGARRVLAARNERVLRDLCDEIRAKDGEAVYVGRMSAGRKTCAGSPTPRCGSTGVSIPG